jgi:hypothetical protein
MEAEGNRSCDRLGGNWPGGNVPEEGANLRYDSNVESTGPPSLKSDRLLGRYLAEFDFRYSYRVKTGYNDMARMDRALAGIVGKRLTYRLPSGARSAASSLQARA